MMRMDRLRLLKDEAGLRIRFRRRPNSVCATEFGLGVTFCQEEGKILLPLVDT